MPSVPGLVQYILGSAFMQEPRMPKILGSAFLPGWGGGQRPFITVIKKRFLTRVGHAPVFGDAHQ